MVAGIWSEQVGLLDPIKSINQNLWVNHNRSALGHSKLIRITDVQIDSNGLKIIKQIADKYPTSTFALMGNYSEQFLKRYSDSTDNILSGRSVLLSTQRESSVASTSVANKNRPNLLSFSWFKLIPNMIDIRWRTFAHRQLALQPASETYSHQLIWRQGGDYYPTFIGQTIINHIASQSKHNKIQIELGLQNRLFVANEVYSFGYQGEFYPSGNKSDNILYKDLLTSEHRGKHLIFLIDGFASRKSQLTARAIANFVDQNHLSSNWFTLILKYLLLIIFVLSTYRIRKMAVKKQLTILIASVLTLFLLQSFFISQSLWLSISLIVGLGLISWLLQLGYASEERWLAIQNEQRNKLLTQATPIFYQTQNFENLIPHLEQSHPDLKLLESIYEVAIEAEAHRNTMLAKQLHGWILEHNQKFAPSIARMSELSPKQTADAELDQTLVIDANGQNNTRQTSNILQIESFGRYRVEGILGKGAMGVVFQGVDPKINRYVAIKTLQLDDDLDGESLIESKERFFREAETAGNLSHANIVTIYDVGEEQTANSDHSLGYIAMDLLTGAPLSKFIKKGKLLPPSLIYQLMIQMTDALDYAHKQKVIHRDIKPANIIYDDDLQRGTLTDFGIAYMSDHSKTKTGTIMGSPYYMSPEQVIGIKVDGRSDIFSLGVTFYQLLSGHLPFTGESIASVAFHITKTKHQSVRQWNKKLPSSAARITNKALQKDVNKRFQTMQEFKQALINALKRDYKKSPIS